MARRRSRYKEMERYMTCLLIGDGVLFFVFLLAAGLGVIWLKVITAILAILVSGLCLAFLYLSQELLRRRSLWMTVGFAAVLLCLLVSLIANYPSPKKAVDSPDGGSSSGDASGPSGTGGAPAEIYFADTWHI